MASQKLNATETKRFTSAERIKQLNDIDKDITALLQSAGTAIKSLTSSTSSQTAMETGTETETESSQATLETQKASFTKATAEYFSLLSSINVRLRRQIYALEEANIISADAPSKEGLTSTLSSFTSTGNPGAGLSASQAVPDRNAIAAGGLGNLDVGWLNSRKDVVGQEKEAELWQSARHFLRKLEEGGGANGADGDFENMDLDKDG
ncbi:MAG: hypothetical protein M1819_006423 [Sarea resinae]|nr:MAG: hypothetical protein M1819_006423 [Sarea resinae]